MWFGYMNRNYEEEIDLPVGADNTFEPGGDRGQPTHFTPRRHKDVFKVTVPKDFGEQTLIWTLTTHGQTQTGRRHAEAGLADRSPAHDARRQQREDQLEPAAGGHRPAPANRSLDRACIDDADRLRDRRRAAEAARRDGRDDGDVGEVSRPRRRERSPRRPRSSPTASATTLASFTEPGEYILQAVVDDGSGESAGNFGYHCCWTNAQVKITVKADATRAAAAGNPRSSAIRSPQSQWRRRSPRSPRTSRRSSRRSARPAITRARPRRCRSSPTRTCGRGRARSSSASPSRDMPPWHLDKTVGIRQYKNDRSLNDSEIETIVRWVDAGAPQGNPADMPPPLHLPVRRPTGSSASPICR